MKCMYTNIRNRWSLKQSRMQRIIMLRPTRLLIVCSLLTLCSVSLALGQEMRKDSANKTPVVTASIVSGGVRIAAPGAVVQLRLEVYDELGQKLFDTEQRGGDVLDWNLQQGAGARVADGAYLCVVTIKDLSGRLSQKIGLVTVTGQSAKLRSASAAELSLRQAQLVGPIEAEDEGLAVVPAEEAPPVAVVAHNGDEAQLTRTRGAISFRLGDFFSANDQEQMRLTEEGNLGIGIAKPTAKLDVAGTIRAREGLLFANGSTLNVNDKGALSLTSPDGSVVPNIAGSGSQDRLVKWTDSSGTIGNTQVSESNGSVVIGNAGQPGNLQVYGGANQDVFAGMGQDITTGPAFNYGYAGSSFGRSAGFFNVRPDAAAVAPNPSLRFMTNNLQRMIVTNTGDVGIGTTNPAARLEVAGNLKLSGAGSSLIFPDGTSMTTAGGGGGTPTGTSIVSAVNDAATTGTINDNRLSPNLARLNTANTFNGNQTVNGNITTTGPTAQLTTGGGAVINCGNTAAPCLNVQNNTLTVQASTQRVGIGVASPQGKLSVAGTVQSTTGGFVFPDGSTQTSAAGRGYTTVSWPDLEITPPGSGVSTEVAKLSLRGGNYLITATVDFENKANNFLQENSRLVKCSFFPISNTEPFWVFRLAKLGDPAEALTLTFTTVFSSTSSFPTDVELSCQVLDGTFDRSWVYAKRQRMTAVRLGELEVQP
jgi:hypothetical protein